MAADGTVSFANRSALDTFGYTQEDLVTGFQVLQLVDPKDRERAERALKQKLESNDRDGPAEYNFVRKDGSTLPVVAYVSPIIQDGKAVGLRGLLLDITDRKKSETELLNIQRLESIAVLAGGIAHDFNNLLTVIMGNVSMAQMYVQPGEPGYRVLAEAEKASLRAKDLSYKLLTFSKGGVPVKRATALQNSIRDTVSLALSGGNVKAECDIADDLCLVDCDPTQISQVINSLVINARNPSTKCRARSGCGLAPQKCEIH
jgi:two-component system cell cycle sensor histidine kinase/response regulator CckA